MYKSPELIEAYISKYEMKNIIVLKSCDVFSLAIRFWQMMNGIEYLSFRLYKKPININKTKYQFIKYGQYDQFWNIHKNCNMMKMNNDNTLLLCNLFEQMFDYNPYWRITIEKILQHKFIVSNKNDVLFHMNDSKLEAFVRDRYHQTKNVNNDDVKRTIAPSTYYDFQLGVTSDVNNDETSGFNMHEY